MAFALIRLPKITAVILAVHDQLMILRLCNKCNFVCLLSVRTIATSELIPRGFFLYHLENRKIGFIWKQTENVTKFRQQPCFRSYVSKGHKRAALFELIVLPIIFSLPYLWPYQNSVPYKWPDLFYTCLRPMIKSLWRAFVDGLIGNDEKVASSKKHTQFKTRVQNPYGWNIDHTLWDLTNLNRPYKEEPPPG